MRTSQSYLFSVLIMAIFAISVFAPVVAIAEGFDPINGRFITCGQGDLPDCTAEHVVELVNNVINFLVFQVAIIIATIVIVWAGVLYIMYPYNPGNVAKAKTMVTSAMIGFGIVLAAYLIVKFIVTGLVGPDTNPQPNQEPNQNLVQELLKIFDDAPGNPNNPPN